MTSVRTRVPEYSSTHMPGIHFSYRWRVPVQRYEIYSQLSTVLTLHKVAISCEHRVQIPASNRHFAVTCTAAVHWQYKHWQYKHRLRALANNIWGR